MASIRDRIEESFEDLGRLVYDHRWLVLFLMALMTIPIIVQIPRITIDTRPESFFLESDPALADYNSFRDQFGMDQFIVIAISPPEVFDFTFLEKLRSLHRRIESEIPYVEKVTSLINARNTRGEGDTLIVEDLMASWPETHEQLESLRLSALASELYVNNLISEDGRFTTIIIRPNSTATTGQLGDIDVLDGFDSVESGESVEDTAEEYLSTNQSSEIVDAIHNLLEDYRDVDFPVYVAGGPAVTHALNHAIPNDMLRLVPLSLVLVTFFLALLYRRASGVVYPLLIVVLALLSTLGLMGALGIPMTNVSTMLTSFILVVGVADSVHILSIFYQRYEATGDKRQSIGFSLRHSGLAVLMTSVTTATGLLSFTTADVGPIADLGIIAPIGIALALIYTLALLPSLIAIFPMHRSESKTDTHQQNISRLLHRIARFSCTRTTGILVVAGIVTVVSLAGMTRLRFSHNTIKWFKEDATIRSSTEIIDTTMRGTLVLEIVIDTGRPEGVYEPDFLARLEQAMIDAEAMHMGEVWVGKASSLDVVIREINRALHNNDENFATIPSDRDLIAQELLLFESTGNSDLEKLVDSNFSMVRATLKVPLRDAFHYVALIDELRLYFASTFPDATITITGANALYVKMFHNLITTMIKSYGLSLSLITLLMILLIGRFRIGLLSMVPNLLPLVVIMGLMGWFDIPFDISTVLIGSVAIGLVVDDTIHFMHNFRRYFEQTGSVDEAVEMTLDTAGRAILITSIVLAGGFYISMVSEMRSSVIYGALVGSTVVLALIADYFVTPALLKVVSPHIGKPRKAQ